MFLKVKPLLFIFLAGLCLAACARKGSPSGGPQDIFPPKMIKAKPDTFETQVNTKLKEIEITFDEYIVLKDFYQNFLISPPTDPSPVVSPQGIPSKKIIIAFNDELRDNTTYSLNFGQSIEDNNEGNVLPYFSYVFSTGDAIDSLELQGNVRFPMDKIMPENILAALYKIDSAYSDSIIYTQKPFYVAKIDSSMHFNFKNLKAGEYRLVAFDDAIANLKFDSREENFAFYSETVNPIQKAVYALTLYKPAQAYRFIEAEQVGQGKIAFYFQGNPKDITIRPISHSFRTQQIIHEPYSDTLTYYFNPKASGDSLTENRPRLQFAVTHKQETDTLSAIMYNKTTETPLKVYGRSLNYVPEKMYQIEANYPIDTLNQNYVTVQKDSIDIPFSVKRLSYNRYGIDFPMAFDSKYKITLYPQAIQDLMQRTNDTLQLQLHVKEETAYGNLKLHIQNMPAHPFWIKLYDENDKELSATYGIQDTFEYTALVPGSYSFKMLVDENENLRYDTGDFSKRIQAEPIYMYPKSVEVKAFWDVEETWVIGSETTESEPNNKPNKRLPKKFKTTRPTQ